MCLQTCNACHLWGVCLIACLPRLRSVSYAVPQGPVSLIVRRSGGDGATRIPDGGWGDEWARIRCGIFQTLWCRKVFYRGDRGCMQCFLVVYFAASEEESTAGRSMLGASCFWQYLAFQILIMKAFYDYFENELAVCVPYFNQHLKRAFDLVKTAEPMRD